MTSGPGLKLNIAWRASAVHFVANSQKYKNIRLRKFNSLVFWPDNISQLTMQDYNVTGVMLKQIKPLE